MRLALWVVLAAVGCVPDNIARSSCESELLAVGDPWVCTIFGQSIEQASSISFDTESRNQVAQVELTLQVKRGALGLSYRDLAGNQHVTVTPEKPLELRMQTRLHRQDRSFTLLFEPQGKVQGLTGTLRYRTP